ncbi:UNKNOWN [Stylonychia lemnae]|uniref:Transmembrane protein n=1 Tax=Stylonychia lemnae TaxID=5949 RepID=A0A078AIU8_STYLE|nr:UNKNOWN [Stylonychia lemnae]|eukprot:CDW82230.1 UNKNOWN [Stylonychia lemnae]
MDSNQDKKPQKKSGDSFRDRFQNGYRALKLKYQGTKAYKNIDSLLKYQQIYYELMNHELPILSGGQRKKKARNTQMIRGGIMLSGFAFFFLYTRMVASNSLVFFNKTHFYQSTLEECSKEMTLAGLRYYFPDHPQIEMLKDLCGRYKDISEKQVAQIEDAKERAAEKKFYERQLDQQFADRLKELDIVDETPDSKGDSKKTINDKKKSK